MLPDRIFELDPDFCSQKKTPTGLVIHSGDKADWVLKAAKQNMQGVPESYHFVWDCQRKLFIQTVSIHKRAYHAGKEGNDWVGICFPGPWKKNPRSDEEREDFFRLLAELQVATSNGFKFWCRHSDITSGKKDPGPGVVEEWFLPFGLAHCKKGPKGT